LLFQPIILHLITGFFPFNCTKTALLFVRQGGFSIGLVGQSLSALVSTSFQYVSACRRCHSFTEAVYFALLSFLGLISSFHDIFSCFGFFFFILRSQALFYFAATLHIIPN
jgi:hypothetical protein